MEHSALRYPQHRSWKEEVIPAVEACFNRPSASGRDPEDIAHRKRTIYEGLGPVWNGQPLAVQTLVLDYLNRDLRNGKIASLDGLIRVSKARWAVQSKSRGRVFCKVDIADIPEPDESAFRRQEFQHTVDEFGKIRDGARDRHLPPFLVHLDGIEYALFRSWEALPRVVTQAAFHVVRHYREPNRQAFINVVEKKAKEAAWTRLLGDANDFLDRYMPGTSARGQAEAWWRNIRHELVEGAWESLDLEQWPTLCGFIFSDDSLPRPRTVAAILQHCEELKKAKEAAWTRLLDDANGFLDRCHRYQPDPRARARAETWWRDIHHELVQGAWESLGLEQYRTLCGFMTAARFSDSVPQPATVDAILRHCEEAAQGGLGLSPPPDLVDYSFPNQGHLLSLRQAARYRTTIKDWHEGRAFK
ncbi:hypothetical protein JCM1840_006936 [Sporobolomyces johnsonii]